MNRSIARTSFSSIVFIVLVCLVAGSHASAQVSDKLGPYLDSAISHAQSRSLYRSRPKDWEVLRNEMYRLSKDAKVVNDLAPALKYLLAQLEDSHGKFLYNGQVIAWWFGEPTENQRKIDLKIFGEIQSRKYPFRSELLKNNVGYLRIPGLAMGDNVSMSKGIRDAVCELKNRRAKHWIVDLRFNGGGNMYPMMQGLAPIIGDATVGSVADFDGKILSTWKIKDADFYYDEYLAADLANDCAFKSPQRVAVLISQYTASSGEAVAVAFKGRPNTRFYGLETAGLVTVTDWTPLNTDLMASISIGYYTDRNGKVYNNLVAPDETTGFSLTEDLTRDEAVKLAMSWLRK